jgi:hypothetical protein
LPFEPAAPAMAVEARRIDEMTIKVRMAFSHKKSI